MSQKREPAADIERAHDEELATLPQLDPTSQNTTDEKNQFHDHQSNVLPHNRIMIVFPALALAHFTAYLDQTSISTAVPAIGRDLALGSSQSWVASSYLLATTSVQLINGRLSDILGRKQLLLSSLALLAIGNLACGFSRTPGMLFTFRTLSGLGGGAITALVQISVSDITTLQQRGKYNGFIGLAVAFGSGLGPLIGGSITTKLSWRWALWYDVPWLVFLSALLLFTLPPSKIGKGSLKSRLRMIDWAGLGISIAFIVLLLIPLSKGGSTYPWNSPIVIAMLAAGSFALLLFLVVEWKWAPLPIMPLHLFTTSPSCNILLVQSLLYGIVFWGNIFHVPLYLINVRSFTPSFAGLIVLPMVGTQGLGSTISGLIVSRTGHYNPVMISSQVIWLGGLIAQAFYGRSTPVWAICIVGFFQGLGVGGSFAPGLVAILAHGRRADRAVLQSLRNAIRTVGGTLGLTIAGTILNSVLKQRLGGILNEGLISSLTSSTSNLGAMGLGHEDKEMVLDAYMHGIRIIFWVYVGAVGASLAGAGFVKDRGLAEVDTGTTLQANGNAEKHENGVVRNNN